MEKLQVLWRQNPDGAPLRRHEAPHHLLWHTDGKWHHTQQLQRALGLGTGDLRSG